MGMPGGKKQVTTCRKRKARQGSRFNQIPQCLWTEILARVASKSVSDLCSAMISCKDFSEAASEDYVFEHMTMEQFPVNPYWFNDEEFFVLVRCLESENPEALFRQGMADFFKAYSPELGLEYLEKAANKGHVEAKYVYGIILICCGGQYREEGLKILSSLQNSKPMRRVILECRRKIKPTIKTLWVTKSIVGHGLGNSINHQKLCNCEGATMGSLETTNQWEISKDDEDLYAASCDSCLWDIEAIRFCRMLRTGTFSFK